MNCFLIIKPSRPFLQEEKEYIIDILKGLFSNLSISESNGLNYIEYETESDVDLSEVFTSINSDLYMDILVFDGKTKLNCEYLNWVLGIFSKLTYHSDEFFFDEKGLIRKSLESDVSEETKKNVLKAFYDDKDFLNAIKVFLECNMNTSKAADVLYMHRNTLINKLDRFVELTGYDIRDFQDAIIIYCLISK